MPRELLQALNAIETTASGIQQPVWRVVDIDQDGILKRPEPSI